MPDTYTKEQIDEAINTTNEINNLIKMGYTPRGFEKVAIILLSALSAAEQERDELLRMMNKSSDAIDVSKIWNDRCIQYARAQKAEARVAELEARLQGAADRGVAWQKKLCKADDWSCENCTECADLRAAIVGKKEGV